MIKCTKVFLFFLLGSLLMSCAETQHQDDHEAMPPYAKMADNQNYCDGAPVVELIYPSMFRNAQHEFTLLRIVQDGRVMIETNLARQKSMDGSYVCLDENLLEDGKIFIGYGSRSCSSYLYGFSIDSIMAVYQSGREDMDFVDLSSHGNKAECEVNL